MFINVFLYRLAQRLLIVVSINTSNYNQLQAYALAIIIADFFFILNW